MRGWVEALTSELAGCIVGHTSLGKEVVSEVGQEEATFPASAGPSSTGRAPSPALHWETAPQPPGFLALPPDLSQSPNSLSWHLTFQRSLYTLLCGSHGPSPFRPSSASPELGWEAGVGGVPGCGHRAGRSLSLFSTPLPGPAGLSGKALSGLSDLRPYGL